MIINNYFNILAGILNGLTMNKILLLIAMTCLATGGGLRAQSDYSDGARLSRRIQALAERYPDQVEASAIAQTYGGSTVWMIRIGKGETTQKPALAIVGGIEGWHLLGVELAIGFAENLLARASTDALGSLLDRHVFYVFPNMSPDATEQYGATLQYERSGNARPVDADRDGQIGEDPFEDLNMDGKITSMRVLDSTGRYIPNPDDPRSMVLADPSKGQIGQYLLLTEGIDNDRDGIFNEDAGHGVDFNKNMTYHYRNFLPGAGEHAVSEIESRALLDFLYDAYNIYAVVSFGPQNNLSHPVQTASAGSEGGNAGRSNSWSSEDSRIHAYVSERYQDIIGMRHAPRTPAGPGNFADWVYFHYGRLSFSTPGWWVPPVENASQSTGAADEGLRRPAKAIEDPVAHYLKWADENGLTSSTFTEWTAIEHPDFPDKRVEVGGVHPFALHNPPYPLVGEIVEKHTTFLIELATMAPSIQVRDVRTETIDNQLTRITLKLVNPGFFPTLSQFGERNYFLKQLTVRLGLSPHQTLVSGKTVQNLGPLRGRDYIELSWLIQGNGSVTIEAGSPNTGFENIKLSL